MGRADQRADDRLKQLVRSIKKTTIPDLLDTGWSFQNSWEHGPLYLLEKMWKDLGIDRNIREKAGELFERTIFLMVANRCLAPQSKLGCYERRLEEIYRRGPAIELQHLYRAMDFLHDHKEKIEESLYRRLADLLNLDVDLVFYDTTSVHFEIEEEDEKLRKRGYSKNGRSDAPQMVVGLAVTRDGFPVKSWVFPGNTTDVTTIEQVKNDLKGRRLNRCIFVADAGMVSEENLARLRRGGGRYIVAMPWRKGTEADEAASHPGRFQEVRENLQVKEVRLGDRRYVVCFNPKEAERQKLHREELLRDLAEELRSLREHPKRACQLMASKRYGRYLRRLKSGELRLNQASIQERERHDGIWIVHSNDDELSAEDLALAYKQLLRVEECRRCCLNEWRKRLVGRSGFGFGRNFVP
ncbi:IS1634 family transposase [bacterium]|nr:MAG: IS1634 family transposase [bacterium]